MLRLTVALALISCPSLILSMSVAPSFNGWRDLREAVRANDAEDSEFSLKDGELSLSGSLFYGAVTPGGLQRFVAKLIVAHADIEERFYLELEPLSTECLTYKGLVVGDSTLKRAVYDVFSAVIFAMACGDVPDVSSLVENVLVELPVARAGRVC